MYLLRLPKLIQKRHPEALWEMPSQNTVYLTFDDGPHPETTGWILNQLRMRHATATFFCIGKNVIEHPHLFEQIKAEGHAVGNHTHTHPKGFFTPTQSYLEDVLSARQFIQSKLFRPPYGSLRRSQARKLSQMGFQIVMWSLLSGDFDTSISPERCLENVVLNIRAGDIVVFHDSQKAQRNLQYALPKVLMHCENQKWQMRALKYD